jgi:hypothetical protein
MRIRDSARHSGPCENPFHKDPETQSAVNLQQRRFLYLQPQHSQLLGQHHRLGRQHGPLQRDLHRVPVKGQPVKQLLRKLKFIKQEAN